MTSRARSGAGLLLALLVALQAACGDDEGGAAGSGTLGAFTTENAVGRAGTYYLPSGYAGEALPVVVYFHGTDGNGLVVTRELVRLADSERFLVVAPDSRVSPDGRFAWEVGNAPLSRTADYQHAQALLAELEAMDGVAVDWENGLAAGHSGGAAMAPYLATNDSRFDAYAVLHGGVVPGGIGLHEVRGWFSTGDADELRTPEHVESWVEYMRDEVGFEDVTLRVYPGGHQVGATERRELVEWWLGSAEGE